MTTCRETIGGSRQDNHHSSTIIDNCREAVTNVQLKNRSRRRARVFTIYQQPPGKNKTHRTSDRRDTQLSGHMAKRLNGNPEPALPESPIISHLDLPRGAAATALVATNTLPAYCTARLEPNKKINENRVHRMGFWQQGDHTKKTGSTRHVSTHAHTPTRGDIPPNTCTRRNASAVPLATRKQSREHHKQKKTYHM